MTIIVEGERKRFISHPVPNKKIMRLPSSHSNKSGRGSMLRNSKFIIFISLLGAYLLGYTTSPGYFKEEDFKDDVQKTGKEWNEPKPDFSAIEFQFVDSPPSDEKVKPWIPVDDDEGEDEDEDIKDDTGIKDDEDGNILISEDPILSNKTKPMKKYAWLMSFPNSGTSYTMKLVRHVSNRTTATNYRKYPVTNEEASDYLPKIITVENGGNNELEPFVSNDNSLDLPPSGYLLTKTHCGGRCSSCAPRTYMESREEFLEHCLELQFEVQAADDDDAGTQGQKYSIAYSPSQIEKAVHLFRSPFDNAISRFHLHRLHETEEWQKNHPKNAEGFQLYCEEMNKLNAEEEKKIDMSFNGATGFEELQVNSDIVPCRAEFHRYISWHENVLKITSMELSIPTHIVYYEDYRDDFETAITDLLNFLELPRLKDTTPPFHISDYSDHFTEEQRSEAIAMMKHQASANIWEIISSRYGY